MASYAQLVRQDVCFHEASEGPSSWPSSVLAFARSLQNELRLSRWLESSERDLHTFRVDSFQWNSVDTTTDADLQQRLRDTFNTTLVDCARIRAVVETERLTNTPYPKESFLATLVCNALLSADPGLCLLDDVPVALPRHFSGETVPILKYMTTSIHAPLVVSFCEKMPREEGSSDIVRRRDDDSTEPSDDTTSSNYTPPTIYTPPTTSEFLDACERLTTPSDVEEEHGEGALPPQFEASFFAHPSSATIPSAFHIPLICMSDEDRLPTLISSLLYQRRVWHISDPLLGLVFSKYDTTIKFYVGWLEEDTNPDRILPRVHLGEMETPTTLDLSIASGALSVTRLLCSLGQHVSKARDIARQIVATVASQTQTHSPRSCTRDWITQWAANQEAIFSRWRVGETGLSKPVPQSLTCTQPSDVVTPFPVPSMVEIPTVQEPDTLTESIAAPTLLSRLSCSEFAATTEKDDHRLFRWMFDRRVVPRSIPSDSEFLEEYITMTSFIWPEEWRVRDDLPSVDAALEPCVQELLDGVSTLKIQGKDAKFIPANEFPVDLRILEQSFSAIFQASRRSREKRGLREAVYEASWRHDHDRLLFDFFIRLVHVCREDFPQRETDGRSIAHLEDLLARPTLEATLRLPKSNNLNRDLRRRLRTSIEESISRRGTKFRGWLESQESESVSYEEAENSAYVVSQWLLWVHMTNAESEGEVMSKLGEFPSTGRCDALGRLLVELPDMSPNEIGDLSLVLRTTSKKQAASRDEGKASTRSKTRSEYPNQGRSSSTKTSDNSLAVPGVFASVAIPMNGTRCSIPSSSVASFCEKKASSDGSADPLASKVEQLRINSDPAFLELPILTVEYKKTLDNASKGTNQLRMYLTAAVKFLQAIGIVNMAVYGVQTDGPIVVLLAAILRNDDFVHLFERLVERLDISTPLGAWHYATILCRLAQNHAKVLEKRFEEAKENLTASLAKGENETDGWTVDHQIAKLKAENRVKAQVQGRKNRRRVTVRD